MPFVNEAPRGAFAQTFFAYRHDDPERTARSVLANVAREGEQREPTSFSINYRVCDLGMMLAQVRKSGVAIEQTQESAAGRFAWCHDSEENRIEIYKDLLQ